MFLGGRCGEAMIIAQKGNRRESPSLIVMRQCHSKCVDHGLVVDVG
jgi:hypothetical protein